MERKKRLLVLEHVTCGDVSIPFLGSPEGSHGEEKDSLRIRHCVYSALRREDFAN